MAERSVFPVFGNIARFEVKGNIVNSIPSNLITGSSREVGFDRNSGTVLSSNFVVERPMDENNFYLRTAPKPFTISAVPFRTDLGFVCSILDDTLLSEFVPSSTTTGLLSKSNKRIIFSQPTDSLLKPMMHRSDNFFAEQSLLMVSNEHLGFMNDAKIIDTLLKTDLKDLPQKPRWVDGSGLSRYNLFTPQDFVFILNKMKTEFGMTRLKEILPTGGEGTLSSYYKKDSAFLYAKTGTLSGVVALSGFLYTKKGKELIFSVLVNNHQGSATNVRRAVEKFIQGIREKY
jgi:D-alanyl-D-alanine carboxypeptidase/D-alanyl-D-alanine-endopeptidase (penicillin-binding protein 4)